MPACWIEGYAGDALKPTPAGSSIADSPFLGAWAPGQALEACARQHGCAPPPCIWSSNMKNCSTGFGLCVLGAAIALYPVVDRLAPVGSSAHVSAGVTNPPMREASPTVVWMGVSQWDAGQEWHYHRLWSDGRIEARSVRWNYQSNGCGKTILCSDDWTEVPPPPAGNGFACRADLNGDRMVDGTDLGIVLGNWGDHTSCTPEATFPCLTLSSLGR